MPVSQLTPISISGGNATTSWIAEGYSSMSDALSAVLAVAPTTIPWMGGSLPLKGTEHAGKNASDDPALGEDYELTLTYGKPSPSENVKEQSSSVEESLDDGGIVWSFQVGGGTNHVTTGIYVTSIGTVPVGAQGVIGASKDGVAGVDLPDNKLVFSLRKRYASAPAGIATTIADIVGKVNSGTFKGLAAGEVLCTGATASDFDADGPVDISYSFAVSKNQTGLSVPGLGTVNKEGWQYLDVIYKEREDTGSLVHTPSGAQVLTVFDSVSFSALGL